MSWLKRDRSVDVINHNLLMAFSRVKHDVNNLNAWINYLHKKNIEIESKHDSHKTSISTEVENLKKWINYLDNSLQDLYKYLEKNNELLRKMEDQNQAIINKIFKIEEQGHVRTSHGTSQGHVRDMKNDVGMQKTSHYDRSILTQSELEILNVFYAADRPLGYAEISKMLNKEEKSIRNLVYELRKKGIEIKDKPIGLREKGFYLTKEEKIKVSGR